MIGAKDDVLYCMCTAILNGEAQRWYENNTSLAEWNDLKQALFERFDPTESLSKIFQQLKQRKQQSDEQSRHITTLLLNYVVNMTHQCLNE
ncbi:unnamed protein product [Didymodactylos carnosus]|uniref:Retrotransposon gag domain-containing protein n=1 Tax=Didymodactylos carnosus TaxID=1234261 RepID=A0A8S2SLI4_9BILA|nr:unnamed protein product [Didymodactylos carnosus]CAF4236743.1 unnamed protein product [Didymodactylos carnosus]